MHRGDDEGRYVAEGESRVGTPVQIVYIQFRAANVTGHRMKTVRAARTQQQRFVGAEQKQIQLKGRMTKLSCKLRERAKWLVRISSMRRVTAVILDQLTTSEKN